MFGEKITEIFGEKITEIFGEKVSLNAILKRVFGNYVWL
jgi:hypothetical protein